MPAKNRIKIYVENGYYHLYNRGVEKRLIFLDEQDFSVFLSYLKEYLMPKDEKELFHRLNAPTVSLKEKQQITHSLQLNNFNQQIILLAYCLMPNHFHLFIKQNLTESIDKFMNSLGTRYTIYFNRKYKRVGPLYQGAYKALLIRGEDQFFHLSRYIHFQALEFDGASFQNKYPSSYPVYIGKSEIPWVHPEEILLNFSKTNPSLSYEAFLRDNIEMNISKDLIID
jgi:putative transposase